MLELFSHSAIGNTLLPSECTLLMVLPAQPTLVHGDGSRAWQLLGGTPTCCFALTIPQSLGRQAWPPQNWRCVPAGYILPTTHSSLVSVCCLVIILLPWIFLKSGKTGMLKQGRRLWKKSKQTNKKTQAASANICNYTVQRHCRILIKFLVFSNFFGSFDSFNICYIWSWCTMFHLYCCFGHLCSAY